jgi:DNA-binding MarR family transcriptional regulator
MQDKGYVTRERSKSDERVVIVSLTDEGRALREEAVKIPSAIGQCVPLEPDEAAALYELLYKVLDKFSN